MVLDKFKAAAGRSARTSLAIVLCAGVAGCGGGGGGSSPSTGRPPPSIFANIPTPQEASRLLTQATFGPTQPAIDSLTSNGIAAWFDAEVAKTPTRLLPTIKASYDAADPTKNRYGFSNSDALANVWWTQVVSADDQLRQRVAYAYSEIFVISMTGALDGQGLRVANYYDTLSADAFVNFRQLLEDVTLSTAMGAYLNSAGNAKEVLDSSGNVIKTPDENYAREVLQLFSIGLVQLNLDGTPKLDANGKQIQTYTHDDIVGIAKAMTGWDVNPAVSSGNDNTENPKYFVPMDAVSVTKHSTSQKSFLGVTIPAVSAASTDEMKSDMKTVLDTIFNHPNVGPFISKQLIQRLVTSNPTPAYVSRVATVFNDNGSGVRGDMKAVVKAILMDSEARTASRTTDPTFGKLREPTIRLANWMRAFSVKPTAALYKFNQTADPGSQLAMTPMNSPTVFNWFRPGYSPPNTQVGANGLLAPELQIANALSTVGYQNYMRSIITNTNAACSADYTALLALVDDATLDQLLDKLNLLLMEGQMPSDLRATVKTAVLSIKLQSAAGTANATTERNRRLWTAIYLLMASPAYVVQK